MSKGFIISFEGGEGCGKSTQVRLFTEYLTNANIDFCLTHEPGGTPLGEQIRKILADNKNQISCKQELLLLSASRNANVENVVKPAFAAGKVVVMDRFFDSSFAYQGYAGSNGELLKDVKNITKFAVGGIKPNLTILLDMPSTKGFERKAADDNLKNLDRWENMGKDYHSKVRQGYLQIAKRNKKRVVIDASGSIQDIHSQIVNQFNRRYLGKGQQSC